MAEKPLNIGEVEELILVYTEHVLDVTRYPVRSKLDWLLLTTALPIYSDEIKDTQL